MYVNPKAQPITFPLPVFGPGLFTYGNRCPRCFAPAGHNCVTGKGKPSRDGHLGRTVVAVQA